MKEELQEREIQNQIKKIKKKKFFVFISCFEFSRSWSSLSIIQKSGKFKMNFGLQYPIIGICIEKKEKNDIFSREKKYYEFLFVNYSFFKKLPIGLRSAIEFLSKPNCMPNKTVKWDSEQISQMGYTGVFKFSPTTMES